MNARQLELRRITRCIGAEVDGIDLARLDDAGFSAVHAALLAHQVLVFRGQRLTPAEHLAFARRFGEAEPPHPVFGQVPEYPQVSVIETRGDEGVYNDEWHTDVTFRECPARGSILHARVLPPSGGDTLWASMTAAYEALSAPIRQLIDGLSAEHDIRGSGPFAHVPSYRDVVLARPNGREQLRDIEERFPPVVHPVVRTHPETGRRALFVNRSFTTRIVELSKHESMALLGLLLEHAASPNFQMRHRWQVDDLVMWDNRCTQHFAVNDYAPARRVMHRVTVLGDRPVFRPLSSVA